MLAHSLAISAALSVQNLGFLGTFLFVLSLAVFFLACLGLYNLNFHPLASYPGPKVAAATRLWHTRSLLSGRLPYDLERLHNQYGDVVRIAPNELSYTNSIAWKEIYGHRSGQPEMPKDPDFYVSGPGSILTAPRERHAHLRRMMSHGFSEKALREQEQTIQKYADMFLKGLRGQCRDGQEPVDMVSWYNFFTFDLIGDLAFGESFGCLETSSYHPWVTMIFDSLKSSSFSRSARSYPFIEWLVKPFIMPKSLLARRDAHRQMTLEKSRRRLQLETDRIDFLGPLTKPSSGVSEEEFTSNASGLILAGSETTATLLSGATFHLLRSPDSFAKLVQEVRSAFSSEDDINLVGVNGLQYMLACLDESLRMYPPVPAGFPRRVPEGGASIAGNWVPEQTIVTVTQWAANRSPRNFNLPNEFIPERWLGDPRFNDDDKAALQPFHVGPRNCLGRNLAYVEMRLILARLLWNFDLELVEACERWDEQEIYGFWQKTPLLVRLKPVRRP